MSRIMYNIIDCVFSYPPKVNNRFVAVLDYNKYMLGAGLCKQNVVHGIICTNKYMLGNRFLFCFA